MMIAPNSLFAQKEGAQEEAYAEGRRKRSVKRVKNEKKNSSNSEKLHRITRKTKILNI